MALLTLTNRDDQYIALPGEEGLEVHGANGSDTLLTLTTGVTIFGENGEDVLGALALNGLPSGGNQLFGGNGKDVLLSAIVNDATNVELVDNANLLAGENGKDFFVSTGAYASGAYGTGADIWGGNGDDTYYFRQSSDVLSTNLPVQPPGTPVGAGQSLQGVFDVINDYKAGELVDIGTTVADPDGPEIGLVTFANHSHVVLDEGTYAFLRGDLIGDGQFLTSDEGADTLLLYDYDPGVGGPPVSPLNPSFEYFFEYGGSVVFVGVTDTSTINIGDSGFTFMA